MKNKRCKRNQYYTELLYLSSYRSKNHQCPYCGHKFNFDTRYKKQICWKCGKYNFKNQKEEFFYKLTTQLKKKGDDYVKI